jgi:hypothetical protein
MYPLSKIYSSHTNNKENKYNYTTEHNLEDKTDKHSRCMNNVDTHEIALQGVHNAQTAHLKDMLAHSNFSG